MAEPEKASPEPEREITLEEWIESCQSCCGIEPEAWCEEEAREPLPLQGG
jgi:hypothetical protein